MWERSRNIDSGWVGADDDDRLDEALAAEAMAEPFDRSRPHVLTALGPIEPAALGPTLTGEHLATMTASADDDNREVLLAELEDAYAVGLRSIVVLAAEAPAAREANNWLAGRAPVHLVLLASASDGIGDRAISGKFGGLSLTAGSDPAVFEAEIRAGIRSDLSFHLTGIDADLAPAVRRMIAHGAPSGRIWIGGNWAANADLATQLLDEGVSLAFDTGSGSGDSNAVARAIAERTNAGHIDQLLLASGSKRAGDSRASGGLGWGDVLDRFPIDLLEAGLSALQVRQLLVENPARLFTIRGE